MMSDNEVSISAGGVVINSQDYTRSELAIRSGLILRTMLGDHVGMQAMLGLSYDARLKGPTTTTPISPLNALIGSGIFVTF
jgi:hypothetical protein